MSSPQRRALTGALEALPRVSLANLPTPLERLDNVSRELDVDVWCKRDDETGLALGGNKARKLEYLLADAASQGADVVITTGGSQSNHARMTAAACRKLGLECRLVLDRGRHPENGNLLLDHLFGARIELLDDPDPNVAAHRMAAIEGDMKRLGRNPYVIPRGGSVPAGAAGYAAMVSELVDQTDAAGIAVDRLYVGTGSCGTHAGIMAGRQALGLKWSVQGISVSRPGRQQQEKVLALADATLRHLGLPGDVQAGDVLVDDEFVGQGYGYPTSGTWKAVEMLAVNEGMILDPVYTGKVMAGLLEHVQTRHIRPGETVVFVHTGGGPALFAYSDEIAAVSGAS